MKIDEILLENEELEEDATKPYQLGLNRMGTALGSMFGNKNMQAQGDVGKRANQLYASFKPWATRTGIDMSAVSQDELKQWLAANHLPFSLPPTLKSEPTLDLTDPETSRLVWYGIANAAYRAAGPVARGTQSLGRQYGLQGGPGSPGGASAPAATAPTPPAATAPTPPANFNRVIKALDSMGVKLSSVQRQALRNALSTV